MTDQELLARICWDPKILAGKPVDVGERVFERDTDITIHLPVDDASAVRAMARSRGVGESELLREWVLDRLHAT